MIKTLLFFGLLGASLFVQNCKSAATADDLKTRKEQSIVQNQSGNSESAENSSPKIEKPKSDSQTINFKGVSFSYNPQIFSEVEPEDVVDEVPLEREEDKPGENFPKHISFKLKIAKQNREATVKIISIDDYRRMYSVSHHYTKIFDENIKDSQKALKDEKFRVKGEVPFIPFYDAHQTITARVKHLSFENGNGIFFLTQYNQDSANPVNNDELTYFYQGISADGKKYVLAEYPASAAFLPKDNQADEFEGYKIPYPLSDSDVKNYKEYVAKITKRLENLSPDEFEPNLKAFEEIIRSLKIEK